MFFFSLNFNWQFATNCIKKINIAFNPAKKDPVEF